VNTSQLFCSLFTNVTYISILAQHINPCMLNDPCLFTSSFRSSFSYSYFQRFQGAVARLGNPVEATGPGAIWLAYPSQEEDGLHQQGSRASLDVVQVEGLPRQPLFPRKEHTQEASSHGRLQQCRGTTTTRGGAVRITSFPYFTAVFPNVGGPTEGLRWLKVPYINHNKLRE